MRIGLSLPAMLDGVDRSTILGWSRRIEADGYDAIGFGERIAYRNLEMFSTLSAAAAVTERVDLAATVVVLPMHSEVWVAKQMATLDVLSGGRAVLGVGVGGRQEDYDALGRRSHGASTASTSRSVASAGCGTASRPATGSILSAPRRSTPSRSSRGRWARSRWPGARTWADGIAGFELDPTPDALAGSAKRVQMHGTRPGTTAPVLMTSWWFTLGDGADDRLADYARHYLGIFGADVAERWRRCARHRARRGARRHRGSDRRRVRRGAAGPDHDRPAELDALTALLDDLLNTVWGFRDLPLEGLAGAAVEAVGGGLKHVGAVDGEVGALGEVLAEQSVGVLVGASLPGRVGVAEVDGDTGLDAEAGVFGHLDALVPGDRAAQRVGQCRDRGGHLVSDVFSGLVVAEVQQDHEAGGTLDQCADRGTVVAADDQVAFPVAGHGSVGDLGRAFADHDHVGDPASVLCASAWSTLGAAGAEAAGEFSAQLAAALDVEGFVDGLVGHPHLRPVGERLAEPPSDLFWGPQPFQIGDHHGAQLVVAGQLGPLRSPRPLHAPRCAAIGR